MGNARRLTALAVAGLIVAGAAGAASAAPSSWTVEASPNRGTGFNAVSGVSCPSADFCMAIGQITPDAYFLNMGMRWNGHRWRLANPRSRKSSENVLVSVACTGPTFCLAVGYSDLLRGGLPIVVSALVERWDGTSWSIVRNPAGTKNTDLLSVSCPGVATCFIIGDRATANGGGVFERWDDGALSVVPDSGLLGSTFDLDCPTTTMCVAVGAQSTNLNPLRAQTFDGTHWTDAGAPVPSTISLLHNVSCADATYCMATGDYYDWDLQQWFPLVETFDGTTWTKTANPPAPYGSNSDVACPAEHDCMVVGVERDGTTKFSVGMVLTWDGSAWGHEAVPREGHFSNALAAASCWSPTGCRAVGTWSHDRIQQTLAIAGS